MNIASSPGSPPPLCFIRVIILCMRTMMTCLVWHRQYTRWTLNASSVCARDQSCPGSPPLMFKCTFRVYKIITRIKQSGGESLGKSPLHFLQAMDLLSRIIRPHMFTNNLSNRSTKERKNKKQKQN